MDVKAEAVRLREKGHTYKEISSLLDGGVSVDWCKRNLKGVKIPEVEDKALVAVIELATRPEGVSVYEANGVIMKLSDKKKTAAQMKYIRDKAKAQNPNCLFRQEWMSTTKPMDSYKSFCAYIIHMQDELDNLVRWYCDSYPEANPNSVKYEMLEYLKPSKDSISLAKRINKAEVLCEQLEQRVNSAP